MHRTRLGAGPAAELVISDPAMIATDIGPVIDAAAKEGLEHHPARIGAKADRSTAALRHPASNTAPPPRQAMPACCDCRGKAGSGINYPLFSTGRERPGRERNGGTAAQTFRLGS